MKKSFLSETIAVSVFAALMVALIVVVSRANGTPTGVVVPTPTPDTSTIAFADCSGVHFGAPIDAQAAPSDVHSYAAPPPMSIDVNKLYEATITTAKGAIVLCLQPALAPMTVNNFVTLARNHFYDGLTFHRVEDYVVQGGDPTGTGNGGPGYAFKDEPVRQQYIEGAVAMANSGPNTNGSQFFIDPIDDTQRFAPSYSLFGKVASGMDVVKALTKGDVMQTVTVAEQQ